MLPRHSFLSQWLCRREEGMTPQLGFSSNLQRSLYSAFMPYCSWDPINSVANTHHGGIFNLEFSPDGSVLIAATERKSILVFDPLNRKLINSVDQAHNDCVNYARFLDSRMFATCSDDTTIALWDIRFLKNKIRSLKGHSNWVKNIEYASNVGLLVTSGFDGSIYTWDINGYSEGGIQFQKAFHTSGLMRMRLTPDNSKMVICTTAGYLMVIHDLDLDRLAQDLQGFKPGMYQHLQMGRSSFSSGSSFNHLFTARRNRVELISDFPESNDAEVISSLQVHPHGWCILSRNTSIDDHSEWTCVHDIQETGKEIYSDEKTESLITTLNRHLPRTLCDNCSEARQTSENLFATTNYNQGSSRTDGRQSDAEDSFTNTIRDRPVVHIQFNYGSAASGSSVAAPAVSGHSISRIVNLESSNSWGPAPPPALPATPENSNETHTSTESFRFGNIELRISRRRNHPSDLVQSPSLNRNDINSIARVVEGANLSPAESQRIVASTAPSDSNREEGSGFPPEVIIRHTNAFVIRTGMEGGARTYLVLGSARPPSRSMMGISGPNSATQLQGGALNSLPQKVHQSIPRLTHFMDEPNVGRGFIKELCFSPDGRLICSPYGFGVRLLGFDSNCSELCDSLPSSPTRLHELVTNMTHRNYVVSTKFSPVHCLLVSGCLSGKISFQQPCF